MTTRASASAGNRQGTVRARGVGLARPSLARGRCRGRAADAGRLSRYRWAGGGPPLRRPSARVSRSARNWPGLRGRCTDRRKRVTGTVAGTPRIVRVGPSTHKGTRRSFLTAPQRPLRRKHLRDPPLCAELLPTLAGLTARARPKARPDGRAASYASAVRPAKLATSTV